MNLLKTTEYRDTTADISIPPPPPSSYQKEIHYIPPRLSVNHSLLAVVTYLAFLLFFFIFNTLAKNFQFPVGGRRLLAVEAG